MTKLLLSSAFAALLFTGVQAAPAPTADQLAGSWGFAAYWKASDAQAAKGWARAACGAPYVIRRSPSGNLMMLLADDTQPREVKLVSAGGKTMITPVAAAAGEPGKQDRAVTAFDGSTFELTWQDSGIASRYGVNVFARCGK